MEWQRASRVVAALALATLAAPERADAQGFGVNEIGTCAVARGFANTSAPCRDASTIFWNPAALTQLRGNNGLVGVAAIIINGDFTQDTTFRQYKGEVPVQPPPHLFWSRHREGSKLGWGLGVYVPYGLTSQWGDDFPGRFSAQKAAIQTVYGQPAVAYQINDRWSVGGGPIVAHSAIELKQSLDLSEQRLPTDTSRSFGNLGIARGTEFARATLTGDAWGFGFNVGLHGKLTENWQFGARYLSKVAFDYEGEAEFEPVQTNLVLGGTVQAPFVAGAQVDQLLATQFATGGALTTQDVQTKIDHPAQAQFGFTYTGFQSTSVSAEYTWIGWKSFRELPIQFQGGLASRSRTLIEDYNNSSAIRVGIEHMYRPNVALRAGASAATSAAPPETVTPLLPEQDRYSFNLGAGLPLSTKWGLDLGYAYIGTWGERGRLGERASRTQTAAQLNTGFYRLNAHVLSLSLKATY